MGGGISKADAMSPPPFPFPFPSPSPFHSPYILSLPVGGKVRSSEGEVPRLPPTNITLDIRNVNVKKTPFNIQMKNGSFQSQEVVSNRISAFYLENKTRALVVINGLRSRINMASESITVLDATEPKHDRKLK